MLNSCATQSETTFLSPSFTPDFRSSSSEWQVGSNLPKSLSSPVQPELARPPNESLRF